jgi:hypothetical protein
VSKTRTSLETLTSAIGLLAVLALGLSAGAMLTEGAVLVPYWRSLPPELFLNWYAANASLLFDFFGPLEVASTALTVAAAALSGYGHRPGRGLLIVSAVLTLAVLAAFPLYFQDVNAHFAAGTIARDSVATELAAWAWWHWLRTTLGASAFVAATLGVRGRSV